MRDWRLSSTDPLTLRLAADVRLGPTDYADDHIWEAALREGEPPALALHTTFGRRAQEMRLFPLFAEGDRQVSDPAEFASPPLVRAFFVNYLRLSFSPLPDVEVTAHYWTPDSHTLAGRYTLVSRRKTPCRVRVGLVALLKPLDHPKPLAPFKLDEPEASAFAAVEGQTGNLNVFVALEGPLAGPEAATLPTLMRTVELAPNEPVFVRWVETARAVPIVNNRPAPLPEGFITGPQHIRQTLARDWEAEFTRLTLLNARTLEIETGDPAWDAALAMAQAVALRAYVGPTSALPHPSFVLTRHTDRGYSPLGDGSDYPWQWSGQPPLDTYAQMLNTLAAAPDLAKGLLRNYLAVQESEGFVDWKPGLGGQRNRTLCLPILAALAWLVYEHTDDLALMAELYPSLRHFNDVWFSPRYDRDEDGVPEWSHTVQSGFDAHPTFGLAPTWAQGADCTQAESPDLTAYLYRECLTLIRLSQLLQAPEDAVLTQRLATLRTALERMWRDDTATYHYLDRDAHDLTRGETLTTGTGDLAWNTGRTFAPAARLLVKMRGPNDARPEVKVTLVGTNPAGRPITETLRRPQWYFGVGRATSDNLFANLEQVTLTGLPPEFTFTLATVDLTRQDLTLLFPLWAGVPSAEHAEALVRRTLLDQERYWRPYGLPACSAQDPAYAPGPEGPGGVWGVGNILLGQGLVRYGYRREAALLVTRLMLAATQTLTTEQAFRESHHPDLPEGLGERNHVGGLAPLGLFMEVLGVRVITPRKVFVAGGNPFPWPITIRHRGVTIVKTAANTLVTFPSGQKVTIADAEPRMVTVE